MEVSRSRRRSGRRVQPQRHTLTRSLAHSVTDSREVNAAQTREMLDGVLDVRDRQSKRRNQTLRIRDRETRDEEVWLNSTLAYQQSAHFCCRSLRCISPRHQPLPSPSRASRFLAPSTRDAHRTLRADHPLMPFELSADGPSSLPSSIVSILSAVNSDFDVQTGVC